MAWLRRRFPPTHNPLRGPAGKTPMAGSTPSPENISLYPNFGLSYTTPIPSRAEGRIAIVTNAGWDVVDAGCVGAKGVCRAGHTVSSDLSRTRPVQPAYGKIVWSWRPGVCAPSLVVMGVVQPGARVSHLQGDGGNSATLPGESTT